MLASYRQNEMTNTVQKMVTQLTIINAEFSFGQTWGQSFYSSYTQILRTFK